jgi:hypothetical protein
MNPYTLGAELAGAFLHHMENHGWTFAGANALGSYGDALDWGPSERAALLADMAIGQDVHVFFTHGDARRWALLIPSNGVAVLSDWALGAPGESFDVLAIEWLDGLDG